MRGVRRLVVILFSVLGAACALPSESPALARSAIVEGRFSSPAGSTGAAWVFLFAPGSAPPASLTAPSRATAISRERLASDPRFVFAEVAPNPWALWGLLDSNGNFDPSVDVLAQPGAGDFVGDAVEINVQPGTRQTFDYTVATRVLEEPPAFGVVGAPTDVLVDPRVDVTTPISLETTPVGGLDPARTAFTVGLVDANHDGVPDDANGDGLPDLDLQLVLAWKPRPGQAAAERTLVVPLAFDPTPFLAQLAGNTTLRITTRSLQVYALPQAMWASPGKGGALILETAGTPPAGEYELLALSATGQFWRLPNQLRQDAPSQATTFHLDRTGG